jgi:hypothetical protein
MRLLVAVLAGALLAVGVTHAAAPPLIRAEAQPATVGVGDTFSYLVEARFDADGLDASSVRIFADTGPFVQAGPTRSTHSTDGSAVVVRLEQRLTCLDLACAPVQGLRRVRLPAARVSARHAGGRVTTGRAAPAVVGVEPRVSIAAVRAAPPPYRQQTALPAATRDAGRLAALLAIAAVAFGLVAVLLVVLALRPRARARAREAELARALRLLRESASRPPPDRRRAADLVSRVVGAEGAQSLADDAARFAWSATAPKPADAVGLAERAEGAAR